MMDSGWKYPCFLVSLGKLEPSSPISNANLPLTWVLTQFGWKLQVEGERHGDKNEIIKISGKSTSHSLLLLYNFKMFPLYIFDMRINWKLAWGNLNFCTEAFKRALSCEFISFSWMFLLSCVFYFSLDWCKLNFPWLHIALLVISNTWQLCTGDIIGCCVLWYKVHMGKSK